MRKIIGRQMKPILFNTEMVRAILDGRKTQTRRIVKTGSYTPLEIGRSKFYKFRDELNGKPGAWAGFYCNRDVFVGSDGKQHIDAVYAKAPYQPGDILWVRETWQHGYWDAEGAERHTRVFFEETDPGDAGVYGLGHYIYKADASKFDDVPEPDRWHPSIHMPREAARIFLRVMDVRVERLWDISSVDVYAEGTDNRLWAATRDAFRRLWDSTIKPANRDRYGWNANPWVWVISFERCEPADPDGGADNG